MTTKSMGHRFGVAVSTGFRRSDPTTGRTIELYLCPERDLSSRGGPDQSQAFFAAAGGDGVFCYWCRELHPVVDLFEAAKRRFIEITYTGELNSEGVCFGAHQIAGAIREAGAGSKAAAR